MATVEHFMEHWVALRHARVGTRSALGNAGAGRFCEGPHYGLLDGCFTHKLRAHEHPCLALNGVAVSSCVGHFRVLRVRLLSIVYWKKVETRAKHWTAFHVAQTIQKEHRRASRRGQIAGTWYPRQANRGTGLGRGGPSADGASGLQGLTFKKCLSRV